MYLIFIQIPITIKDFCDGKDYTFTFSDSLFNSLISENKLNLQLKELINKTINQSNLNDLECSSLQIILFGGNSNIFLLQQTVSSYLSNELYNRNSVLLSQNNDIISLGCSYYNLIINNYWKYKFLDETNSIISKSIEEYVNNPEDCELKNNIHNLKKDIIFKECQYQMIIEKKNELNNLMY